MAKKAYPAKADHFSARPNVGAFLADWVLALSNLRSDEKGQRKYNDWCKRGND